MFWEMLDNEELIGLRTAYDEACVELGLTISDADQGRRERLAVIMLSLAKGGEREPDAIRAQAIQEMNGESRSGRA
jgi:hypothetical protein